MKINRSSLMVGLGMLAVFLYLLFRNMGLFPVVMADEWTYSMSARHLPLSAAHLPSYLYLWIFRATNHSGRSFLECARVLNCIFFVGATPFIYQTARRVTTPAVAAFVAVLSILAPVNTYTSYFMPEAMYFGIFWVLSWFVLRFTELQPRYYGSITGIILGCLSLTKVHAMFLVPGIAAFILFSASRSNLPSWHKNSLAILVYVGVAAASVRLGLGYLLAGRSGLHLFGSTYGDIASSTFNVGLFLRLNKPALFVLVGHFAVLALLFGVPLASLLWWGPATKEHRDKLDNLAEIKIYTIAIIIPLLIVVAYFTASIAVLDNQSIGRLHVRYYSFALPLLFIVAAGEASLSNRKLKPYFLLPLALLMVGAVIYLFLSLGTRYAPNVIDCPEMQGLISNRALAYAIASLGIISLVAWSIDRLSGARLFLFAFMPLCVLGSAHYADHDLRGHLAPSVYEKAGMFARQVLPADERSRLAIVGASLSELFKTAFLVDDPGAALVVLPKGVPLDEAKIPDRSEWVLLVGDNQIPAGRKIQYPMGSYSLYRLLDSDGIKFSRASLIGVSRLSGISGPEPIGRWSDGKEAEVDMAAPLPTEFELHIVGSAFGPNADLPFSVRVGNVEKTFRLPATTSGVSLDFTTDGKENRIIIDVPDPITPKELGINSDTRHLGILLKEITITPIAEPEPLEGPSKSIQQKRQTLGSHAAH